ncbi:MAG TPA: hypothetical protein PK087_05105, partial [Bacilli bacterium]|nr:hypothetical protein [Bacilli bacterium]
DLNQFMTLLNAQNNSDFFSLSVIRNNKEVVIQSRMIALVDEQQNTIYRLGVEALPDYKIIDKFPKYKLNDKIDSIGGSGGAMLALAIYNSLLAEDITMGKTIVGTGTINIDGKIGDIGAVSQKIVTASLFNVDYFFVNPEDYEEAYQKYQTINPSFELVKVNTFQDILIYLEGEKHG